MVPAAYNGFFTASVGASAALIGLLFVAVSVFPDRIVGPNAESERQAEAANAFSSLLNAFFISLGALIPGLPLDGLVFVMGIFSLLNTCALVVAIWRAYRAKTQRLLSRERISSIALILGSFYIYGSEIWWGFQMLSGKATNPFSFIASLLLVSYGLALVRAWGLLGARRNSIGELIGAIVQGASDAAHLTHENHSNRSAREQGDTGDTGDTAPGAAQASVNTASTPAAVPQGAFTPKTPQAGDAP